MVGSLLSAYLQHQNLIFTLSGALCSQPWDTQIIYIKGFLLHTGKACSPRNRASFSHAPASPQCPMQSFPSFLNQFLTKIYHSFLGETRLLVEPTRVKPVSSKPDSFCSCSHSLPRMSLLGALPIDRRRQGRTESYQAGKMETIAFAGKLSGHIGNV